MKNILQQFKRLTKPEKFLVIGLSLSFFLTFTPWFFQAEPIYSGDKIGEYVIKNYNAYTGITAVIGYFYSIFTLLSLITVFISIKDKFIKKLLDKYYWFFLACTGESLFLLVLTLLIYTSYSMKFSRAGIKYGLFFVIIANIVTLFASHFYFLNKRKIRIKQEFTMQMHPKIHLETENIQNNKKFQKESSTKIDIDSDDNNPKQMSLADV